jgi:hypothetical protein
MLPPEISYGVTGIGSLPHRTYGEAIDFVLRHCPEVPYLPELPAVSPMLDDGLNAGLEDVSAFVKAVRQAGLRTVRAVKTQIVGPVTFDFYAADELKSRTAELMRVNAARIRELSKLGVPVIAFADEPGLHEKDPSELPPCAVDSLHQMIDEIRNAGAISGIHCCGALRPGVLGIWSPGLWSLSFARGGFDFENAALAGELRTFLARGKGIAFGIDNASADGIRKTLSGMPLPQYTLLTPPCGLAFYEVEQAERCMTKLRERAALLRDER